MTVPAPNYPIALDQNRELAAEIGLLLSTYAIIDLFILHIYSVVAKKDKDSASVELSRKRNSERIELIRGLLDLSDRPHKDLELQLVKDIEAATRVRNKYAHAIYSQFATSPTGWRMSMWLSAGPKREKKVEDISVSTVRTEGAFVRTVLESLFHFGSIEVACK